MKKKIIIGVIVVVIVIIGGWYLFTGRSSVAVSNFNSFINDCTKFKLDSASQYVEANGDLNKAITTIQGYDQNKQNALKDWAKQLKVTVVSTKKQSGEVLITAKVYSPNGVDIYNQFQTNIQNLDINSQTIQDSNENGDYLGTQYTNAFVNAIEENVNNIKETDVVIKMKRSGGTWKIQNDDAVMSALLGGLNSGVITS